MPNLGKQSEQSKELADKLWEIACSDLRGLMDSFKFKNYILGVIFYRYLSEHTEHYMDSLLAKDNISYRDALQHEELADTVREWSLDYLGYVIEPENLFSSLIEKIKEKTFTVETFENAIKALTNSTLGQPSEPAFDKLFDDMNLQDKDLGKEVSDRTKTISGVMLKVNDIPFDVDDAEIDIIGTAYMILISLFASDAGKKGGDFFTPACASKLVAKLATVGLETCKNACDPTAGSGSLLLKVAEELPSKQVGHYYCDELNGSTYNLLRMSLLMHGISYQKFTTYNEDIIEKDRFYENDKPILFTVQVSNPPFSQNYTASSSFLNDPRFSAAGAVAPKSYEDLMFVEHVAHHMDEDGRAAIVLPHGVLFRGGTEGKIRRYLIEEQNVVDAVIGLAPNIFHGTPISTLILILRKKRNGNSDNILFIDASKKFKKEGNKNIIPDDDIDEIVQAYVERKEVPKFAHVAYMSEIIKNEYNLNIPRYVDTTEEEVEVDIAAVRKSIDKHKKKAAEIEAIVNDMLKELGL